jgi:hypothetical protein
MNTRRNVSCEGMPCFSARKFFSHAALLWAYSALSSQLWSARNHATDGHDHHLKQVVLHFVGTSGIVYLGKWIDEVFEQGALRST